MCPLLLNWPILHCTVACMGQSPGKAAAASLAIMLLLVTTHHPSLCTITVYTSQAVLHGAAEKTDIMGRWAARADNTRLKQMHPHWLKHLRGPDDVSWLRTTSLLDAAPPDQMALQVRPYMESQERTEKLCRHVPQLESVDIKAARGCYAVLRQHFSGGSLS